MNAEDIELILYHVSWRSSRVTLALLMDTSANKRASILALHLNTKMTQREISEAVNVSKSSVNRVIKRFKDTGTSGPLRKGRCGRRRKTTARTDKKLVRRSLANPRMTAVDLKNEENLPVSRETVGRRLREAGRIAKRPIKRPLLTKKMRSSRRKWAKDHRTWGSEEWKKVRHNNVCLFFLRYLILPAYLQSNQNNIMTNKNSSSKF